MQSYKPDVEHHRLLLAFKIDDARERGGSARTVIYEEAER
jgi:hypothetical protein